MCSRDRAGRVPEKSSKLVGRHRGPKYLQQKIFVNGCKNILYFFHSLASYLCWTLLPRHLETFHITLLHIFISMQTFNSDSYFWWRETPFLAQSGISCMYIEVCVARHLGERKPIPFWRFLKRFSWGSTLRNMLAFSGNNSMKENTITVNSTTGVGDRDWSTGHCFQELAINTSQQYFRWRELSFISTCRYFFPGLQLSYKFYFPKNPQNQP